MSTFLFSNFALIYACVDLKDVLWALLHMYRFFFFPSLFTHWAAQSHIASSGHRVPFHPLTHATDMSYFSSVAPSPHSKNNRKRPTPTRCSFRGLTFASIVFFSFVSKSHPSPPASVSQSDAFAQMVHKWPRERTKGNVSKLFKGVSTHKVMFYCGDSGRGRDVTQVPRSTKN